MRTNTFLGENYRRKYLKYIIINPKCETSRMITTNIHTISSNIED